VAKTGRLSGVDGLITGLDHLTGWTHDFKMSEARMSVSMRKSALRSLH
jgi:hypothetical protein